MTRRQIQLSLSGNGKLVILSPATLRMVWDSISSANRYRSLHRYASLPARRNHLQGKQMIKALDREFFYDRNKEYSEENLTSLQNKLNTLILEHGFHLTSSDNNTNFKGNKIKTIFRHGMIFQVKPLRKGLKNLK